MAAIKLRGEKAKTNFVRSCYDEIESSMALFTFPEMVMALRRQSTGLAKTKTPRHVASRALYSYSVQREFEGRTLCCWMLRCDL